MHVATWLSSLAACLSLLPSASAFYPHDPASKRNENLPAAPLSFRIRRTPIKRANTYNIVTAVSPTQTNSVGVDQDGSDYSYMASIQFGSSKDNYHLLLDSAASNTWVMSAECTTDVCSKHNTLGPEDSNSLTVSRVISYMSSRKIWARHLSIRGPARRHTYLLRLRLYTTF